MSEENYRMYTLNSPIFGLDVDLNNFLDMFVKAGSPRFSDFAELWKQTKFIHLIYGRQTQASLKDVIEGIFFYLVNNFTESMDDLRKIGSLYIIYAFFGKQPILKQARVNVTVTIWRAIQEFIKRIAVDQQWDCYYIFRRLCVQSAFRFVVSQEDLYPGVPLYTRSSITLPVRRTYLTKTQRRLLSKKKENDSPSKDEDIVPDELFDLPGYLKSNWNAIYSSVNEYIATKNQLAQNSGPSTSYDNPAVNPDEDNALWSMNLVTYKDSIAPISNLISKFSGRVFENPEPNTDSEEDRKEKDNDIGARRRRLRHRTNWCSAARK